GDEAWDFITNNDLYMPFEDPYSVVPITVDSVPTGGAHVEGIASGVHQHFFDSAAPFAVAATEHLYCWVYLDPNNPPREIMLQWHTTDWEHRAFWGSDLIDWGTSGTVSRLRVDDLPDPGGWVRLELPASSVGLGPASLNGMAFTLFDGCAAFGSAGAVGAAAGSAEREWLAGGLPSGAHPTGIWNFLAPRDLYAPTPASRVGQVEALAELIDDPALASLSGQERSQLPELGLQGFIDYLTARADRADDIVDHGFVKVQTDVYRIRQLMQGNTAATRLAVSPALATIAQTDSAVASSAQIDTFLANLKAPAATFNAMVASPQSAAPKAAAPKAAKVQSNLGITKSGISNISTITLSGQNNFVAPTLNLASETQFSAAQLLASKTAITPIVSKLGTSYEVTNAAPVIGNTFVRTTAIAQRLEDPAAKEAADYATASRYDAVTLLLQLADDLRLADSGVTPGLFDGVVLNGLEGDTFLGANNTTRTRPFADFINPTIRATILPALLVAPARATDPDESSYFSDSSDLSDHVVALMRQMEGRIKLYRDAISACQSILTGVQNDANSIQSRIAAVADSLAEARHDVSVAQALLAEETDRINGINDQRAKVLAEQVRFLAFVRPREVDNLLTAPRRDLDPALIAPPVPTCLMDHSDIPDDLQDMLQVIREAPSNWFVDIPKLIDQLDKPNLLIKTLQSAQIRTQMKAMLPVAVAPATQDTIATAIARVTARQSDLLSPRVTAVQSLNIASLATATWQGVRSTAVQLVSLGDLIDGAHGRGQVATDAANAFNQMSRIAACLHAEFSGVLPAIRLDWAETLSEFDAAPNLRNLGSLARWSEIDYVDRRQMQSYVDWLFAQIDPNQASAESLINDVVRMCLLLASHAPVDRIIAGRMKQPVTGVQTGVRLPLTVIDPTRLRVGMQALMYRGGSVVARALVEDIGNAEVSARVIQTSAAKVDLGDDVRVQYSDAAAVSLTPVRTSMTKSLFA
ncbi:MAG TPA: hypothetical protein VFW00_09375, partial [Rhodocyclaceae bacterium]|nr:hypothetical protein [Rhodocyclaceae bacterium]